MTSARLAVDIGGTFTDLALEREGARFTAKTLTTPAAPEQGVLTGIAHILRDAGLAPGDVALVVHGTTLATNAIIERKGAATALITTEGFRDVLAMGNESRYDQYDLQIRLPEPLVPRHLRLPVPERVDAEWPRAAAAGRRRGARAGADAAHRARRPVGGGRASCIPSPTRCTSSGPARSWPPRVFR